MLSAPAGAVPLPCPSPRHPSHPSIPPIELIADAAWAQVLEVAQKELLQECDYEHEAAAARQFKLNLAPHPEFDVPAVVPALSSKRVLTTEWMPGMPIDRAAAEAMSVAERDRVGSKLLWLSLHELFRFRYMQTDPNWSNFLYDPRTQQISLIDFGACQSYSAPFVDAYLQLVRACADGESQREAIPHHSHVLGFLTGQVRLRPSLTFP